MHFSLLHFSPSIWCFQSWRKMVAYTVMQWFVFRKNSGSFWHTLRAELQSLHHLELGQDYHTLVTHKMWLCDLKVRSEAVMLPGLCSGVRFHLIRSLAALRFPCWEEAQVTYLEATCRCSSPQPHSPKSPAAPASISGLTCEWMRCFWYLAFQNSSSGPKH